ncbi:bifunctional methylenetetrahydrofolate dehydrogenase/methenyltetrahydrofolate cyclohydrolase [Candidatus Kuenenbacteria bacterium CG10_big_fil_rev_8_21_14_0_10_36_11]|uniref:Bifunctional protein FolD n=1 Tax=Candidatus Kuenenbacteria bacterium CG10_big_fil_rev_8_21_14_0_10_36_11 TaxID=1974618 RepID=A0A2M6W9X8_9BACT|nr:MAG: bifunctional methylenetetrahydrofolate dehydrogenase/methenyltetrahydrofolate cyclohydrolase [Candidatus Kuenenbacteria bacterium CG10_big_fil_rev_8_21_14_0_10_36_11]
MSKIILNGKFEAEKIIKALKHKNIKAKNKISLAVVLIGNNSASKLYVSLKEKKAAEIGVGFKKFLLPATVSEKKVLNLIDKLNKDKKITGILVQLPLPKKFNTEKIISAIDVKKDVDGFKTREHENTRTREQIIPPTIQAILHLIKMTKINLAGKKAIILANSFEFAEPLTKELEKNKILVKIFVGAIHELPLQTAMLNVFDIIIIALGKKHFLKPEMIKKNAVIIDVGINRIGKKIFGDVHPDCFKKLKYISPVPGGVGPLTVAYLFKNLLQLNCRGNSRHFGGQA